MQNTQKLPSRKVACLVNGTVKSMELQEGDPLFRDNVPLRLCSVRIPGEVFSKRMLEDERGATRDQQQRAATLKRGANFRGVEEMKTAFELETQSKNA